MMRAAAAVVAAVAALSRLITSRQFARRSALTSNGNY